MNSSHVHLKITVRPSRTALQRCLQIASKRGFILRSLLTRELEQGNTERQWQAALPELLNRSTDVLAVATVKIDE